ncbi:hypothetical protein [Paenarthrobacter sp. CAP02]|uniref:hypothetical protein n=1 Tax=Paenarthrobacter sp. CAP02 TaxID=3158144 RepID=UPI0032DB0F8E
MKQIAWPQQSGGQKAQTGFKNINGYGDSKANSKGMIGLSGKSPINAKKKKSGKTILEKRAEKRAKAEGNENLFAKPRKSHR